MAKINVRELKATLSAVLERVAGGEAVTVFKRSEPVAELRPVAGRRKPGILDHPIAGFRVPESFFEPLPDDVLAAFEGRDRRVKLLLDTVAFLWVIGSPDQLGRAARAALEDTENGVFLSAASVWEIAVKNRLGKLPLPMSADVLIPAQRHIRGIEALDISESAVLRLPQLPDLHRDPFDRMLVCQAIEHEMTVVTPDAALRAYPIRTLW